MKKVFVILFVTCLTQSYAAQSLPINTVVKISANSENPTDFIYRASKNQAESAIEFLNKKGEKVLSYPIQQKYDISTLPSGVYVMQSIDAEGNVISKNKFVKS